MALMILVRRPECGFARSEGAERRHSIRKSTTGHAPSDKSGERRLGASDKGQQRGVTDNEMLGIPPQ